MIKISASELKRNTSDVLNKIIYGGETVVILRHNKEVAKITPNSPGSDLTKKNLEALNKKYAGSRPNFPDVKKYRRNKNWNELLNLYSN